MVFSENIDIPSTEERMIARKLLVSMWVCEDQKQTSEMSFFYGKLSGFLMKLTIGYG